MDTHGDNGRHGEALMLTNEREQERKRHILLYGLPCVGGNY